MKSVTTTMAALAAALVVTPRLADPSLTAVDSLGKPLDMARSRASIQRTPPERTASDPKASPSADPDAIRFVVSGKEGELPKEVMVVASDAGGAKLDEIVVFHRRWHVPDGSRSSLPYHRSGAPGGRRHRSHHPLVKDCIDSSRSRRSVVGSFGWSGAGARFAWAAPE